MKILRVRRRILQTPVITWRKPGRPGTVTVVGVAHLGEPGYYAAVAAVIDEAERGGAAVHYELIDQPTPGELAAVTGEEIAAYEALRRQLDSGTTDALAGYYGWVYQTDALAYPPRWRNTDMNSLELVRALGPENIIAAGQPPPTSVGQQHALAAGMSGVLFRLMTVLPVTALTGKADTDRPVILDQRNEIALAALPPSGDVVLIWGAEHLIGIGRALCRAGFRRISRAWLPAGTLPPLHRSLADLAAGLRAWAAAIPYERGPALPADPDGQPRRRRRKRQADG